VSKQSRPMGQTVWPLGPAKSIHLSLENKLMKTAVIFTTCSSFLLASKYNNMTNRFQLSVYFLKVITFHSSAASGENTVFF
jgi:hypothetical protein